MLDIRPILFAISTLVVLLAIVMLLPAVVDFAYGHPDWSTFLGAAFVSLSLAGMIVLANRGSGESLNLRQAFIMTALAWVVLPAFAALPFTFSELNLSFTDAYFEAMSGLTTTGSTILTGLDTAPPGILLWRALLQWFGGIGIIVMAIAILPLLQIGGMQLFHLESSDTSEKILPRAAQISMAISGLYVSLTALCTLLLILAGLSPFDAISHAMTTIATGGFSTRDASVGHFDSALVDTIIITFMIIGSLPFVLYLQALRGRTLALWQDEQARTFLLTVLFLVTATALLLIYWKGYTPGSALRYGAFNIISIMTGTGYATTDYGQWGAFSVTLFFMVMFIGGCAGSTSCGIKIFRFQVLFRSMQAWTEKLLSPNGIFIARFNGRRITHSVTASVMSFFLFFMISFLVLSFLVAMTGVDWITAMSGAGTALANVGPGLGSEIGPAGNFSNLPDVAKWLLSFGMLIGRLELFAIFVLMTPSFWRA